MEKNKFSIIKLGFALVFLFFSCNFFDDEPRLLSSFNTSKGAKIEVYYVDMGATTKTTIQVRTSEVLENNGVVAVFDHNVLKESKLLTDTTLLIVLKDSGATKLDTVVVQIADSLRARGIKMN